MEKTTHTYTHTKWGTLDSCHSHPQKQGVKLSTHSVYSYSFHFLYPLLFYCYSYPLSAFVVHLRYMKELVRLIFLGTNVDIYNMLDHLQCKKEKTKTNERAFFCDYIFLSKHCFGFYYGFPGYN